jgi:hypothetical protein
MERSGGALRSVEHFLCRSARSLNHVGSSVSVRSAVYSNHRCNTPSGPLIPPPYHFVAAASNSCLAEPGLVWVTMPNQGVNPHYSGFRIGEVVLNFARWLSRPPNGVPRRHCVLAHRERGLAAPSTGESGEPGAHRHRVVQDLTQTTAILGNVCVAHSLAILTRGPLSQAEDPLRSSGHTLCTFCILGPPTSTPSTRPTPATIQAPAGNRGHIR